MTRMQREATAVPHVFPWTGLLCLAAAGFITIITEALPAGLLPTMSASLGVSEALIGQLVTVYALGSVLAAIPVVAHTRRFNRRPLLLTAIAGFAVANTITALSGSYTLILAARFVAGVSGGLLWALVAGHALRMVPGERQGRAMAVALVGAPLALSLGIPAGTWLGNAIGWRATFGIMSAFSVGLFAWARFALPDYPGLTNPGPLRLRKVIALPGVAQVLGTLLVFILAHNIIYTYIAPLVATAGAGAAVDRYLLVFGLASVAGIWLAGAFGDAHMRALVVGGVIGFLASALAIAMFPHVLPVLVAALAVWGVGFGATPTLLQTALARNAGESADVAQSLLVTGWNVALALGGIVGGAVLDRAGAGALAWSTLPLIVVALLIAWRPAAWRRPAA
ncbi:MFS transporter [Luteibacter aegosomatissinici]|uniref:MFS transporter n=1 Tax=Luteibacter aegosomatissinici TaxID=2911539 RepID=UPI001FFA2BE1|nr:MFS transporter [Luteibacter aegosomatissinici]UPG96024.1 MFS transporter [Luteibacter aegosomatissinici]